MPCSRSALAPRSSKAGTSRAAASSMSSSPGVARATVGAKLFTIMLVDMPNELSRRAFTSDPVSYPTSATKPLNYGPWFDIVHGKREYFVANTIEDIAKVLFDHELINSLGCQSVINMPIILGDELVATMNILDIEGYYTPERVQMVREILSIPAKLAVLVAQTREPKA